MSVPSQHDWWIVNSTTADYLWRCAHCKKEVATDKSVAYPPGFGCLKRSPEAVASPPPEAVASADLIDSPAHYAAGRMHEPIDVIEDWGLGYHLGNATKYISRAGRKGGPEKAIEDLKKARWYIDREIARREKKS